MIAHPRPTHPITITPTSPYSYPHSEKMEEEFVNFESAQNNENAKHLLKAEFHKKLEKKEAFDILVTKIEDKTNSLHSKKNHSINQCMLMESEVDLDPIHTPSKGGTLKYNKKDTAQSNVEKIKEMDDCVSAKKQLNMCFKVKDRDGLIEKIKGETEMMRNKKNMKSEKKSRVIEPRRMTPFEIEKNFENDERNKKIGVHHMMIQNLCEHLYTEIEKSNKHSLGDKKQKDKLNWCSNFLPEAQVQMKSTQLSESLNNLNEEDEFEYVIDKTPGPTQYFKEESMKKLNTTASTFGNSSRFSKSRPVTAQIGFLIEKSSTVHKNNNIENVSFGTNKSNPRSQEKKVLFCEWDRPHTYQNISKIKPKKNRENAVFCSTEARSKPSVLNYTVPDFYPKDSFIKNDSRGLPSYYFMSEIERGTNECEIDGRDFLKCEENKTKVSHNIKKLNKKHMPKLNETAEEGEFPVSIAKNSLGSKARKIKMERFTTLLHSYDEKYQNYKINTKNYPSSENPSRPDTGCAEDTWTKQSFNVKFQQRPKLLRF